jgi:hypothetical protein
VAQLKEPKRAVASKPARTRRVDTPLRVMERAYRYLDKTARRYQAQLDALPSDANTAERARLEDMTRIFYLSAVDVASKAAPFFHARLTAHLVKPHRGTDKTIILYRRPGESDEDVRARARKEVARKETAEIIERAEQGLSSDSALVMIFEDGDQNI